MGNDLLAALGFFLAEKPGTQITRIMLIGMIYFACGEMLFFTQSTQGSKAHKEISLREIGWLPLLHSQNEDGIETNPFPPFAFRLPNFPFPQFFTKSLGSRLNSFLKARVKLLRLA
jgi:hypothetical protein